MRARWLLLLLSSCTLVSSFDSYDPVQRFEPANVSGTVDGLDPGEKVTLRLNGESLLDVGGGAFVFPPVLAKGAQYVVTAQPDTSGFVCTVDHAAGVATKDVTDVAVNCVSADATLSSLAISAGPLSPPFDPSVLDYSASTRVHLPSLPKVTTTVTATATRPDASVTIAPTPPIVIGAGANLPIIVTVTAPDGKHSATYSIAITGAYEEDLIQSPNASQNGFFGTFGVAMDGDTIAAGELGDSSGATGIDGDETDTSMPNAGAAFVFVRSGGKWTKQAYIKASNTRRDAVFGKVALSGDTLVVGSPSESSNATGIDGDQGDTSAPAAGAAYVFVRNGSTWLQQAYVKASNTSARSEFGWSVSVEKDTLAVGSPNGQAYVFVRNGTVWSQQSRLLPATPGSSFGWSLSLSGDTLAVGAVGDSSPATGINGDPTGTSSVYSGAVYVFVRSGTTWSQQAYIKASNSGPLANFGQSVSLSGDTLVVGADGESSNAIGVDGNQSNTSRPNAGAAYVFQRTGTTWAQQAYLKPSNTPIENLADTDTPPSIRSFFGAAVAVAGDSIAVGAPGDCSASTGIDRDAYNHDGCDLQTYPGLYGPGAVFFFSRTGTKWSQVSYVKAFESASLFGSAMAISGSSLCVGSAFSYFSPLLPPGWIAGAGAVHVF